MDIFRLNFSFRSPLLFALIVHASVVYAQEEANQSISTFEQSMIDAGLVDIQSIIPDILVELKYSGKDNFVGVDVYGNLEKCYLHKEPALMLARAQQFLKEKYPDYSLLVYDGARPRSVQQILWDTLDAPIDVKPNYVANPSKGSIHNYGSAVDLTIADKNGNPLDMGTGYDHFGALAYPTMEKKMLKEGKLTKGQIAHRKILRSVMTKAGFRGIDSEWWHFNAFPLSVVKSKYSIIE
ncbi:M15 family metallopeptidase [Fulvivirgaceae bacterium BMA10]|uniref:D-alanyl-D-alanine dipeptidase n=1 Tax=Splendidivirga corallicola TaxID=3051826 RepID=A0ABT8KQQ8_9BACT|nr:M15 family metallopeptidase [Fulvivirgaceae bacterium BMA10]